MKRSLKILLAALLCAAMLFTVSCGTNGGGEQPDNNENEKKEEDVKDLSPAEISELAMDNFVKKLQAGNYVCGEPDVMVTNAVSPEQVYIQYPHVDYPTVYGYMTLDGETFGTMIENNIMYEVGFVAKGNALDALGQVLPNYWYNVTGGNMFELFYNDVDKPLEFTSNDETVKYTVACLAGYSETTLSLMQEVRMVFDSVDPDSVHFTAEMESQGMIHYDDLDLTITFGGATGDEHLERWFENPVYPDVRTGWTRDDTAMIGNVFMRDYGSSTVPFPDFASYALLFDSTAYDEFGGIRITDTHATEQDVEDYKAVLLKNGYKEVEEEQDDGSTVTVYRKLLREKYKAYAELYPTYNNGLELVGIPYYDEAHYEGLSEISGAVKEHGFAELDDTDLFSGWSADDQSGSRTEGFAYFFDYDLYLPFILTYSDEAAAREYWDAYLDKLPSLGFEERFVAGEDSREFTTPEGDKTIGVYFDPYGDSTVTVMFKSQALLTAEEVNSILDEAGVVGPGLSGNVGGRDQAKYRYEISGFEGLFITATQYFSGSEEAEAFLDSYAEKLEDSGYVMTDPQKLASVRQFMFFNEDNWSYVAFDYYPGDTSASVLFEFFHNPEVESSMMLGEIAG